MDVKERTLAILEERRGEWISGAAIAETLGVSRNAVWKAVQSLTGAGYPIAAERNRGYLLAKDCAIFSAQAVEALLKDEPTPFSVQYFDVLESTNVTLKQQAEEGAPEGRVLIADRQTGGKGRMGRSFFSPNSSGLYMSVLLRPSLAMEDSLYITAAAAVAVARVLERESGIPMTVKWVNDIFARGKKVCGILTEAALDFENHHLRYAILGVGVNLTAPEEGFPEELKDVAGAVFEKNSYHKSRIAAEILKSFFALYRALPDRSFMAEYRSRSHLIGQQVVVTAGTRTCEGVVETVDDEGKLILRDESGTLHAFLSGEARVRKA